MPLSRKSARDLAAAALGYGAITAVLFQNLLPVLKTHL
jgi:hypothetical protein